MKRVATENHKDVIGVDFRRDIKVQKTIRAVGTKVTSDGQAETKVTLNYSKVGPVSDGLKVKEDVSYPYFSETFKVRGIRLNSGIGV